MIVFRALGAIAVLVLLVAAGKPDPAADGRPRSKSKVSVGMGNALLKKRKNVMAAEMYRKQLATDPESVAAHVGLGKSLARQGRCELALEELAPYADTRPFGADAALLAAICSHRIGFLEDALLYDRLAVELDPDNARAWSNYALDLDEWGDPVGVDEILERLDVLGNDGRDGSLYARAVLALRKGDIDEFDVLTQFWAREGRSKEELRRLLAQSWLDMGDPLAALAVVESVRKLNRSYQEQWLRAEAYRRLGEPETALELIDRHGKRPLQGTAAEAERIRAYVDLGRIADAHEALHAVGDVSDEEIVASRWYVARSQGDTSAQAAAELEYASLRPSPLRKVEYLVPIRAR